MTTLELIIIIGVLVIIYNIVGIVANHHKKQELKAKEIINMPKVKGKKFPYTAKGKKAAAKAKRKKK